MSKKEIERIELEILKIRRIKEETTDGERMSVLNLGINWLTWVLNLETNSPFENELFLHFNGKNILACEGLIERRDQRRR